VTSPLAIALLDATAATGAVSRADLSHQYTNDAFFYDAVNRLAVMLPSWVVGLAAAAAESSDVAAREAEARRLVAEPLDLNLDAIRGPGSTP